MTPFDMSTKAEILDKHIGELGLDARTVNALEDEAQVPPIFLVRDLLMCSQERLLQIPNVGTKTLEHIYDRLERYGFYREGAENRRMKTLDEIRDERRASALQNAIGPI